jgi:hypothetical protein
MIPGGFSVSGGLCTPLQNKTIQNSRVLGYGQLKGHVASIVSMFYEKKVLRKEVCLRGTGLWNMVSTRYGAWKVGCCLQEILQRKLFFISKKFCKEKYSFLKSIITKTSLIHDIYERNYITCEIYFY